MKHLPFRYPLLLLSISLLCWSCNNKLSRTLFKPATPHERYAEQLKNAGLKESALYRSWMESAARSINQPTTISVPYAEKGYFASELPEAVGLVFEARQGEQLQVNLSFQSADSVRLFMDLFEVPADTTTGPKHLVSAKDGDSSLSYAIDIDGRFLLRLQPELLARVSYDLQLTAGPSLEHPVAKGTKNSIESFWGVARDAGQRKHEGLDIFAARSTPAVAAAKGVISRVGTNNLGGKVVFLRPEGRSINLYYAHLDSQLVVSGQPVEIGDTIGLIGNTGNAMTTPPHLHFGIYTNTGAVDPLPFIRPGKSTPAKILANTNRLGEMMRLNSNQAAGLKHTPVRIEAATQNGYRVVLPNRQKTFVLQQGLQPVVTAIRTLKLDSASVVYAAPHPMAAQLKPGPVATRVKVIGEYEGYYFIEQEKSRGWIAGDGLN
ncbi:murein DD-endopeptidase MepM/ murein hydrolase activator NlpD [Pedobacter sp. CAN_A7]|uniref:M23 family metallopeptidase n=1 Tax=Pedobacter sp. CAN_A7 TaxID=2787722 RepID=UPI0018CBA3B4